MIFLNSVKKKDHVSLICSLSQKSLDFPKSKKEKISASS